MLFGRSRVARVRASRGFSSPSARLVPAGGGGGGASGCSFGASELASVSSVHSWTGDAGVALWRRTPHVFYVRLALLPHLCTFDEVMGWESDSEC